jgi:TATA-box binding protein (TBP) (component of TFIID and TFIIIB)
MQNAMEDLTLSVPSLVAKCKDPFDGPTVVNIVGTATTLPPKHKLNLSSFAMALPSAQYVPGKFSAVIFRMRDE